MKRLLLTPFIVLAIACNPAAREERGAGPRNPPPATPLANDAPSASAPIQSPPALLKTDQADLDAACNRTDEGATLFVLRSPEESRALAERLKSGPVAVRYHDCKLETLPSCSVPGRRGTLSEARGCCETAIGCIGVDGSDCDGALERYWFGDRREWLFNLPELWPRASTSSAEALVVSAQVRREYRLERGEAAPLVCQGATHVIARAHFGTLRVETEGRRANRTEPTRTDLVPATSGEALIDVTLTPLPTTYPSGTLPCMGRATYRGGSGPGQLLGEAQVEPPKRCVIECSPFATADCPQACLAGERGRCRAEDFGASPELDARVDAACAAGFGAACSPRSRTAVAQLTSLCEHGGDQAPRACAELSKLLDGEAALNYAVMACERGRLECERAGTLLEQLRKKSDPRYQRVMFLACITGDLQACCPLGEEQIGHAETRAQGLKILNVHCAESVQACCRVLKAHHLPVPPRRFQPD